MECCHGDVAWDHGYVWETLTQQRGRVWETLAKLLWGSGTQESVFTLGRRAGAGVGVGAWGRDAGCQRSPSENSLVPCAHLLVTSRNFADTCHECQARLRKWQGHQCSHMRPRSLKTTMLFNRVPSYFVCVAGNRLPINTHAAVPTVPSRPSAWTVPTTRCSWLLFSASDSVGWAGATWTLGLHRGLG